MEETRQEVGTSEESHKQWDEASANLEAREGRPDFNSPQAPPNFLQQQNCPALSSQIPAIGLQNSNALPQMPMYPSRFYYQCYAPSPYPRQMFDPCASYQAFYQSEGQ